MTQLFLQGIGDARSYVRNNIVQFITFPEQKYPSNTIWTQTAFSNEW